MTDTLQKQYTGVLRGVSSLASFFLRDVVARLGLAARFLESDRLGVLLASFVTLSTSDAVFRPVRFAGEADRERDRDVERAMLY